MSDKTTEMVFILDKSGSMCGLEKDVIGGFNAMIEEQKAKEGKAFVSTVLFSGHSQVVHDRKSLDEIKPMTREDYMPHGATALLDAIGDAIKHIGNIHKYARKEDVPARTVFIITTDGYENASRRYNSDQIKALIRNQEEKYGWEFLFVADNIDAVETAETMGIRRERAANYSAQEDTVELFSALSETISEYRERGEIRKGWATVERDNSREKKDKSK